MACHQICYIIALHVTNLHDITRVTLSDIAINN